MQSISLSIDSSQITIQTGKLAKQANGSVLVTSGDNSVLVTAVSAKEAKSIDFLPLTVEYQEKLYAVGKIPGGYLKREGRPSEQAVLNARIIDRPIRPLFPSDYHSETQVVITVLSADGQFPVEVLGAIGASAALHVSNIPFDGPVATAKLGWLNGELIINPTTKQLESSSLDMLVSYTRNGYVMIEGACTFATEEAILKALSLAESHLIELLNVQDKLQEKVTKKEKVLLAQPSADTWSENLQRHFVEQFKNLPNYSNKKSLLEYLNSIKESAQSVFPLSEENSVAKFEKCFGRAFKHFVREETLATGKRIDGRHPDEIRKISCEVDTLPCAHGSALFQRGETQVLGTVTLGMEKDVTNVEDLRGKSKKTFSLHYNFPPYSVGEVGRLGGQSRREIGHGYLAERSIRPSLPSYETFPYAIRVVSEVLTCNGSSSMGTICASTLGLLAAGVPLKEMISGIAMGLIKNGEKYKILSDIIGDEDHFGDMDFKVAGSKNGITGIQMDLKIPGISIPLVTEILQQANRGRIHIIEQMEKTITKHRDELSPNAPQVQQMSIPVEKIRELIGPGGKNIKEISAVSNASISVNDDGVVTIGSYNLASATKAIEMIRALTEEAEVGKIYFGKIVKIVEFGAFVQVLPGSQGLLHISEISTERVLSVKDHFAEGDSIEVKVIEKDRQGRLRLTCIGISHKN